QVATTYNSSNQDRQTRTSGRRAFLSTHKDRSQTVTTNDANQCQLEEIKNSSINSKTVNVRILQEKQSLIMNKLQNTDSDLRTEIVSDWQKINNRENRIRNRKCVIGCYETTVGVKIVPRNAALHVSRLHPNTKADDPERTLVKTFPDVKCELRQSKHA
ncbi:hypothetical protein WA026_012457, partial [Henosepilachna vigintioctopunctata]